jgi:GT2 family glycosyltransferase
MDQRVAVVVATRNRRDELLASLGELVGLPEGPEVLVVDNASSDGSAAAVRSCLPQVRVVALATNRAAAARTIAARLVRSPYVAFADDDSSWEPGALSRAADLLDRHPDVGLVAGKVLVGWARHPDPVAGQMAASPLGRHPGTGLPRVLGFLACAAVVRRSAYLAVGGFPERLGVGGEETVVALDLAAAGWELVYDAGVVALTAPHRGGT